MLLVGCKPPGRLTEQHDVFFGIGKEISDLIPSLKLFWPEAENNLHVDAWREISQVEDFSIRIVDKKDGNKPEKQRQLFFINLGGYRPGEFEEYHHKMLVVAENKPEAVRLAKQSVFYKETGFGTAPSHVDDKYLLDVDDAFDVMMAMPTISSEQFMLEIEENIGQPDKLHIGYFTLDKLKKI